MLPELWLYALGALFILTTLFLPRGLAGLRRPARRATEVTPEIGPTDSEAVP
jgi:urea transport system permease protein